MRTLTLIRYGWPLVAVGLWSLQAGAQEVPDSPESTPSTTEAAEATPPDAEPEAATGPQTYALDPASSFLAVVVYNDENRWTPVTGHDHVMKAQTFSGTVVWDSEDAAACDVQISVPASALQVDPPGARERMGLDPDGAIGDGQKGTVVKNMLGKHVLAADAFPDLSFASSSCDGTTGAVQVRGELKVHGVGKAVAVPMTITLEEGSFHAKGTFDLGHADFGMKPFTYGPGTPRNAEKLTFVVDVQGDLK